MQQEGGGWLCTHDTEDPESPDYDPEDDEDSDAFETLEEEEALEIDCREDNDNELAELDAVSSSAALCRFILMQECHSGSDMALISPGCGLLATARFGA